MASSGSWSLTCVCREVIERRPEEFKIQCLQQIQALFSTEHSPMHAGFGNRHNVRLALAPVISSDLYMMMS